MELTISDDLNLTKIALSGQCFRIRRFDDGTFRFITEGNILYIRELSPTRFDADCTPEQWETVWVRYFDLSRSYEKIRASIPEDDSYMRRAAEAGKGIRILRQSPWETLVAFIISQRKSIPAIQGAVELLAERYGKTITTTRETVRVFPDPAEMADADTGTLVACKLGYRSSYVLDAIEKTNTGALDLNAIAEYADAELLERLRSVCGVGNKVANCVALFAYGRTGLAPVDTWIGKVIRSEYAGKNPFPAYGDAAGIMQQYMFYDALKHKKRYEDGKPHRSAERRIRKHAPAL